MKKKGVSLMVAYSILVVIGIALGAATYAYLELYLPSIRAECPADISVSIEKVTCNTIKDELSISLLNRGLFSVPAIFVRFGAEDRRVKDQLNRDEEILPFPLTPNDSIRSFIYEIATDLPNGKYMLEIQPAIIVNRILVPCDEAVVAVPVICRGRGGGGEGGGEGGQCGDGFCDESSEDDQSCPDDCYECDDNRDCLNGYVCRHEERKCVKCEDQDDPEQDKFKPGTCRIIYQNEAKNPTKYFDDTCTYENRGDLTHQFYCNDRGDWCEDDGERDCSEGCSGDNIINNGQNFGACTTSDW